MAAAEPGVGRSRHPTAAPSGETLRTLEAVEQRITTIVDVSQVVDRKRTALHAHAGQIGSSLGGKLPASQFRYAFGRVCLVDLPVHGNHGAGAGPRRDDGEEPPIESG
jgi:LmbE family N-acetylglucosaminyl deacetylase